MSLLIGAYDLTGQKKEDQQECLQKFFAHGVLVVCCRN